MSKLFNWRFSIVLATVLVAAGLLIAPPQGRAYSVLTHQFLVDLTWDGAIRPYLLSRFPNATEAQLREAHAFAYGGSAIQDMGYYPFGNHFFSDLTHYVRAGDFVAALFREARTLDECAFAAGALAHYVGDSTGHPEVVNPATAIEFPKLKQEFGPSVTYDQSPHGHIRTEFAFDIGEMPQQVFAPSKYLKQIGIRVPRHFLERVFQETYGFKVHIAIGHPSRALQSYATSVRSFIPAFARGEAVLHHKQFPPNPDDEAFQTFSARAADASARLQWKGLYKKPGFFPSHLVAAFIFVAPKIGPLSDLAIKIPTVQTEAWYFRGVNDTVDKYEGILNGMKDGGPASLDNLNLDTGKEVRPGSYPLVDKTYARLLKLLTDNPAGGVSEGMRRNILNFYGDSPASSSENGGKGEKDTTLRLETLKGMKATE